MADSLTILALDVDGVLCPVFAPGELPDSWPNWSQKLREGIAISEEVLTWLKSLEERKRVRVGWLTTWGARAAEQLAPAYGLPEWPVLNTVEEHVRSTGWWKLSTVTRLLEAGHTVLWVDDDLDYSRSGGELDELLATGRLTYVSPEYTMGLTAEDLEHIDSLLEDR